ncbi:MAG: CotH kinase family protein [Balneolaceae bacterium]|nr:CotH kinase family protein [Balneolaceae bacterium]MBO6547799.1 CotH kinase family protein [Balneolaceae bacterium]MBO6648310.1 CotH kinase family protein [Balneolaceae bacterium]
MKKLTPLLIFILLFCTFCDNPTSTSTSPDIDLGDDTDFEIPDWTTETHSNDVDPIYDIVFEEGTIKRLDITISESNWSAMQADLDENLTGSVADIDFTPVWVPGTISFEGTDWYKVGIRYKGNSTLLNASRSGGDKYPFKLDFDEFEDEFPQIDNQRFYGFKQLNLSNNNSDGSFMREKVAADLFREFGVVAPRVAFYAVYLDRGNGSDFIGLYTLIEEVDDSVPDSQFPDDDGNLYKPDGDAASFADGTYDEEEFDLKTNEDEANYSDVRAFYDVLHSDLRTSNETEWKNELESIFNVDNYLRYLAVNNVIQNWDTYGKMTHNYFLYNDEGRLTWIPWDNNEAFQDGKQGGALSLGMSEVGSDWPIIRYIMDVDEYESAYKVYISEFCEGAFETSKMTTLLSSYQSLIDEYASQESSSFSSSVSSLKSYIQTRNSTAEAFID